MPGSLACTGTRARCPAGGAGCGGLCAGLRSGRAVAPSCGLAADACRLGEPASFGSLLYFRCGTEFAALRYEPNDGAVYFVSKNHYHAREAAAALLKMARAASDPAVAAGLIEVAAKLQDQAGELPPPVSAKAPDVQP